MMPKLIALARRRTSEGMPSTGTPNISDAVIAWMSTAIGKCLPQLRDIGDVREHAQFDLAVVGRNQLVALFGNEGCADLAALGRAYRNILQIGIGRREPSSRCRSHRIGGVDTPGPGWI